MKQNIITFKVLFLVVFSFLLSTNFLIAQKKQFKVATVAFYNLENLFDTIDTPDKHDFEYTPEGEKKWDSKKYLSKQENMSMVIAQIGADVAKSAPAIIGVSEIENRAVLEDLVKTPALKKYNYKIVHYESPDRRGVDVGLLYQAAMFEVKNSVSATLKIDNIEDFFTRDQLLVSGELDGDLIHVIVNHWPSRYGGEKNSRPRRNAAADLTRSLVDSLIKIDKNSKIIIMGDLNDDPNNESVLKHLKARKTKESAVEGELFNTTYPLFKNGIGTLAYRDKWNLFDQMIISHPLIESETGYKFYKTEVFNKDFLKRKSGRYKGYPFRTHAGGAYINGYSDHFPVYMYLIKEIK
ncbi:MAG: endonuclease/exonuclease/phosphatase family protein [Bacteroidales bacterium]|nr:endonuclease/exonuclease/phosphatase family protein [Bacteroidales bacterium]